MLSKRVSRRSVMGGLVGLAAVLPTAPYASVFKAKLTSWLFGPKDLRPEADAVRALLAQSDHPDFRLGSIVGNRVPGCRAGWYLNEKAKRHEALFGTRARCSSDVLRKYAMFEEIDWRGYANYTTRTASARKQHHKLFGHWYAQLDADRLRYGIDINPWWQEDAPKSAMVNGEAVYWRDGRLQPLPDIDWLSFEDGRSIYEQVRERMQTA